MADKPNIPNFPNLPDFGQMIAQACEVVANVRGIPYDFNGTLSLDNKFTVLFKTVKEMFGAQDALVKSYKELYEFVNLYFDNLDVQQEINNKLDSLVDDGTLSGIVKSFYGGDINVIGVNSVAEMTDHNRQYVLLTDENGYIYFWNGTEWKASAIKYGTLSGYIYTQYPIITSDNISGVLTDNSALSAPLNSLLVFGPSAVALASDLPNNTDYSIWLFTTGNAGSVVQYAYGRDSKNENTGAYFRTIYEYGTSNPKATSWVNTNFNTVLPYLQNTNYPIVTSDNISNVLTNNSALNAPLNSLLVFGPSAITLATSLPNNTDYSMWLFTTGNSGSVVQYGYGRDKANKNTGAYFRTIYNYGKSNANATPWEVIGKEYQSKLWCFFGDSICYREIAGYGFPDILGIQKYTNCGKAQAVMAKTGDNNIPSQIDEQYKKSNYFDGIILEGGYNDWYGQTLGNPPTKIADSISAIDASTTCGGLEYCLFKLITQFNGAKIYFLKVHKINNTMYTKNKSTTATLDEIMSALEETCRVYGVEVIDCYNESNMCTQYTTCKNYTQDKDGIHPTKPGFQYYYKPVILKHINNY